MYEGPFTRLLRICDSENSALIPGLQQATTNMGRAWRRLITRNNALVSYYRHPSFIEERGDGSRLPKDEKCHVLRSAFKKAAKIHGKMEREASYLTEVRVALQANANVWDDDFLGERLQHQGRLKPSRLFPRSAAVFDDSSDEDIARARQQRALQQDLEVDRVRERGSRATNATTGQQDALIQACASNAVLHQKEKQRCATGDGALDRRIKKDIDRIKSQGLPDLDRAIPPRVIYYDEYGDRLSETDQTDVTNSSDDEYARKRGASSLRTRTRRHTGRRNTWFGLPNSGVPKTGKTCKERRPCVASVTFVSTNNNQIVPCLVRFPNTASHSLFSSLEKERGPAKLRQSGCVVPTQNNLRLPKYRRRPRSPSLNRRAKRPTRRWPSQQGSPSTCKDRVRTTNNI